VKKLNIVNMDKFIILSNMPCKNPKCNCSNCVNDACSCDGNKECSCTPESVNCCCGN